MELAPRPPRLAWWDHRPPHRRRAQDPVGDDLGICLDDGAAPGQRLSGGQPPSSPCARRMSPASTASWFLPITVGAPARSGRSVLCSNPHGQVDVARVRARADEDVHDGLVQPHLRRDSSLLTVSTSGVSLFPIRSAKSSSLCQGLALDLIGRSRSLVGGRRGQCRGGLAGGRKGVASPGAQWKLRTFRVRVPTG
jgi:hypothetical protein